MQSLDIDTGSTQRLAQLMGDARGQHTEICEASSLIVLPPAYLDLILDPLPFDVQTTFRMTAARIGKPHPQHAGGGDQPGD